MKKIIAVSFYDNYGRLGNKQYHYFTNDDTLKTGDHVVVFVGGSARNNWCVVQIVAFPMKSDRATKWIHCKVPKVAQTENAAVLTAKFNARYEPIPDEPETLEVTPEDVGGLTKNNGSWLKMFMLTFLGMHLVWKEEEQTWKEEA